MKLNNPFVKVTMAIRKHKAYSGSKFDTHVDIGMQLCLSEAVDALLFKPTVICESWKISEIQTRYHKVDFSDVKLKTFL